LQQQRILEILPTAQAKIRHPCAAQISLAHHVLLPGLINMHTHSPMTLLRGYADDVDMQTWLQNRIWPVENRFLSVEFVADGTELAIAEMLRAGTTCFNELYFYPEIIADLVLSSGMRACIGLPVLDMPTVWSESADDCLRKADQLFTERGHLHERLSFALAPHAPYTVGDNAFREIVHRSALWSVPIHLHLLETEYDVIHSQTHFSERPLQRLQRLGVLNDRLLSVHMTQLQTADIELISESGVHVIHCPRSNLKLSSGYCPVGALQTAGVNVSIGTDGAASNNKLDALSEAQTAALLAKGQSGDATSVNAFNMLEMLTINAARALRQEEDLGSIEAGKWADLAALDLSFPETQPVHNVISQIAYAANCRQFTDVWVAGKRLLSNGVLTGLDLHGVMEKAEEWRTRIAAESV
jgi:5-methylthioadenosine/S-adenosylhomocysteine deaminase